MIKILQFSDTHHHITAPYATRTGEYHSQIMNKVAEAIQIAKSENVDAIVHDGDVFHSPVPEYEVLNDVMELYEQFEKPIYVNPGNHDMLGDDIKSLKHTGLGTLEKSRLVHILRDKSDYRTIIKDGITLGIFGTPFNEMATPSDLMLQKPSGIDFTYHSIHHMLIAQKFNKMVKYISVEEIMDTEADVTSCGHNHIGMAPFIYENKLFLSNGSISRLRKPEMAHQPKVTIIEYSESGVNFRHHYLTDVKYADSIFVSTDRAQAHPQNGSEPPVFINKRDKQPIITDVPLLLNECAEELGLQSTLPATLSMYSAYKQKAVTK